MNANEMAAEAVSMVAAAKVHGLTVNVRGNMIAVQLVRDSFDHAAFENYCTIVNRMWDALSAISGCAFNKHRAGGVELSDWNRGRVVGRKELYMTSFEVFTEAERFTPAERAALVAAGVLA